MSKQISPHEEKMLNLRMQMQHNNTDLADYIKDLDSWEKDIKKKEEHIKVADKEKKDNDLPPVRNTIHKKKLRKKRKEKSEELVTSKKISGYDFHAWDKFDVDAALEDIDKEEKNKKANTSSSEYETDEEWEVERKKYLAAQEKDKGNDFLKKGDYEKAIEAYSRGIQYDPTNAILSANRAMALLKQQKFAAAEFDCTSSIALDPMYVKAYLRRATARAGMGKMEEAVADFNRVLDLEPSNKQAKTEIERLQKEVDRSKEAPVATTLVEDETGKVKPIYKPPEERSKKPLFRVSIEEIGLETTTRPAPSTEQSELAKKITNKEKEEFEKLFVSTSKSDKSIDKLPFKGQTVTNPMESLVTELKDTAHDSAIKVNHVNQSSSLQHTSKSSESISNSSTQGIVGLSNGTAGIPSTHKVYTVPITDSFEGSGDTLCVPQSSFQFQTDFKQLKHKQELFFQYFKAISPELYPKLFGQSFDAEILTTILNSLALHPDKLDLYKVLKNLSKVQRFSMTAMFLSKKEKKVADDLIKSLQTSSHSDSELATLRKAYDL